MEEQVKLMRWWRTRRGQLFAQGFADDVTRKNRPGAEMYRALPGLESAKLERGEPVYVNEQVVDLVTYAAETARPEPLNPADLFVGEGFALLEKPVYLVDVHGKKACFRAFAWGPVMTSDGEQLHISLYAHMDDDDDYTPRLREEFERRAAESGVDPREAWLGTWGSALSLFHAALFPWDEVPELVQTVSGEKEVAEDAADQAALNLWRFTQSFFRLAEQRVITYAPGAGDRHARKRMRRLSPRGREEVLVVTLRRPVARRNPDAEEQAVAWTRRWLVQGHWRMQWYPSLGEHRQKWIETYVKGPEDMPLVVPAGRAWDFSR